MRRILRDQLRLEELRAPAARALAEERAAFEREWLWPKACEIEWAVFNLGGAITVIGAPPP